MEHETCATLRQDVRGRHGLYMLDGAKTKESRGELMGWSPEREATFRECNIYDGAELQAPSPSPKNERPEAVLPSVKKEPPAPESSSHKSESTALDSPASASPAPASGTPQVAQAAFESVKSECVSSVAKTLADGLNFTEYYLNQLEAMPAESLPGDYESALDLIADRMDQGETDSASFSGVEAPMCARRMLHYALEKRLQRKIQEPKVLHMVEWDAGCQQELLSMDEDACLYGDVSGFFRDELAGLIAALKKNPSLALETLAPLLEQKKLVKRSAFCLRHKHPGCKKC